MKKYILILFVLLGTYSFGQIQNADEYRVAGKKSLADSIYKPLSGLQKWGGHLPSYFAPQGTGDAGTLGGHAASYFIAVKDSNKITAGNYVTRKRVDSIANLKANIDSPSFTGKISSDSALIGDTCKTPIHITAVIKSKNGTTPGLLIKADPQTPYGTLSLENFSSGSGNVPAINYLVDGVYKWQTGLDAGGKDFVVAFHKKTVGGGTDVIYILDEDYPKIGIVENNPTAQLHINNQDTTRITLKVNTPTSTVRDTSCQLWMDNGTGVHSIWKSGLYLGSYNKPSEKLEINGNGKLNILKFRNTETAYSSALSTPSIFATSSGGSFPFDAAGKLVIQGRSDAGAGNILFVTGGTPSYKMNITNDHVLIPVNVGIGLTSTPTELLHIKGASWPSILIESTGGGGGNLQLKSNTKLWQIYLDGDDIKFDDGTVRIKILAGGLIVPTLQDTTGKGSSANVGCMPIYQASDGHYYGLKAGAPPAWVQLDN